MGKIVMPKNSALLNEIEAALKIYYDAGTWISNDEYKEKLKKMIGDDQYASSYTKKSQITSYFGFTEWQDINNARSLRRITPTGNKMYLAIQNNNEDAIQSVLMDALETVKFGRMNFGCPESDSDVEPPALFIRAILDMGYLTYREFAYLLWKLEDLGGNYTDSLYELKNMREIGTIELSEEANKYVDCKPIMILVRWGFLKEDLSDSTNGKHIIISPNVLKKYEARLRNLKIYNVDMNIFNLKDLMQENENKLNQFLKYTPEWFKDKSKEFLDVDEKASQLYKDFLDRFSPEKLAELQGLSLITTIFLNDQNKFNLCHELEYDNDIRFYFGSIKNGNAYKYGLFYSPKEQTWMSGTNANHEPLSEADAISLGTKIRDYLLTGVELITKYTEPNSTIDYIDLYQKLDLQTEGYINKIWFMKYYHMIFPNLFPCFYSKLAQENALKVIGEDPIDNPLGRMGQLNEFVKKCNISNVVFGRIFHTYCVSDSVQDEEDNPLVDCLEIKRIPRKNKMHPMNFIIYGAPGSGKTYSTAEYAMAIIENRKADFSPKTDAAHNILMEKYKEYKKKGQIVFTTFHQNYGYEEFIQGLRPDKDCETMKFQLIDGTFKAIADRAIVDDKNNYVIIIDEINRANISKVFGELITLIEEDKRWGEINETSVTLQSGNIFAVPNNLYIVGTMNSADKSISLIDAALRRRFIFIEQKPDSSLVKDSTLKAVLDCLNNSLVKELDSTDLLIGHSYFMNKKVEDLQDIFNNSIIPLLYEYFYDNRKKVAKILENIIMTTKINLEIVNEIIGRLKVKVK